LSPDSDSERILKIG